MYLLQEQLCFMTEDSTSLDRKSIAIAKINFNSNDKTQWQLH